MVISTNKVNYLNLLAWVSPLFALLVYGFFHTSMVALLVALLAAVVASVHHAEVIAHKVGEPLGTLVLALSVTIIEVALILSMMLKLGEGASMLARDTVFSSVMIILNGMLGLCMLVGGRRHHEQRFRLQGVSAALAMLAAIVGLTLVLPNYTSSANGPFYSTPQLMFIAAVSFVLYLSFVFMQAVRHRDYFLSDTRHGENCRPLISTRTAWVSFFLLIACLTAVVLLAKAVAPAIEHLLEIWQAPKTVIGILIALVVLLPEGIAALNAARHNQLQTSMNLALGSALASIGLTIPAVAILSYYLEMKLALGIDAKSVALLVLSLFVASISLGTGRTTMIHGIIHLTLFMVYLFLSFVP